jgi:microcystin-dependent protein
MAVFGDISSNELKENYYIPPSTIFPYAGTAVGGTAPAGWLFCDGSSVGTSTYPNLFSAIGYSYGGSGASFTLPDLRGRVIAGRDIDNGSGYSGRLSTMSNQGSVVAAAGGSQTHTLGTAELPTHSHSGTVSSGATNLSGGHTHSGNVDSTNTDHTHILGNVYNAENDNWANVFRRRTPTAESGLALTNATSGTSTIRINAVNYGMTISNMNVNQNHTHSYTTNESGAHTHTITGNVNTNSVGGSSSHNNIQPTMVMNYIIKV